MSSGEINEVVEKDIEEKEKNQFEEPKQIDVKNLMKEDDVNKKAADHYGDISKGNLHQIQSVKKLLRPLYTISKFQKISKARKKGSGKYWHPKYPILFPTFNVHLYLSQNCEKNSMTNTLSLLLQRGKRKTKTIHLKFLTQAAK